MGVVGEAADEGLVDLEDVQRQALEVTQGGIARAEVVDGQLHAEVFQLVQHRQGLFGLAHDEVFGNFQLQ
ncbi:hypothetical protein D3C84_1161980 [compost metagenome]